MPDYSGYPGYEDPDIAISRMIAEADEPAESCWSPVDLRAAWRGEKEWPRADVFKRNDGTPLLPPGLNYLHGDSGDGKSLVALIACLTEMDRRHPVIWVTYEDANEQVVVERLQQLGATEEQVLSLFHFIVPDIGLKEGTDALAALANRIDVRLLILDSIGAAMSIDGVDEDRDREVGPWFDNTLSKLIRLAPDLSVWPIDHSTKDKNNRLFPSGSKRKRAVPTGRAFLLEADKSAPFVKGAEGWATLTAAKDRTGVFRRGEEAARIVLNAEETPYRWSIIVPKPKDPPDPDKPPSAELLERVSQHIAKVDEASANAVQKALGLNRAAAQKACRWLHDHGYITKSSPHKFVKPYEAEAP